jgi:Transglutaminase-like superfamily
MDMQETTVEARTLWQLLALDDAELEATDLVEMNLSVAREIPSLKDLDVSRYCRTVDQWTDAFRKWLPGAERKFRNSPWKWKNDIHFFRVGMLAGFLGHEYGIIYNPAHKHLSEIRYTDPGQLFLHGLIDTKLGTCGNMATLHVAVCRRMGWPVSLACVKSHFISRFDNGQVVHNVEVTQTDHPGTFSSDTDAWYMKKLGIPQRPLIAARIFVA